MEDYFKGITTRSSAKKRYKSLAKKWHPDVHIEATSSNKMAEINSQYRNCLVRIVEHECTPTAGHASKIEESKVDSEACRTMVEKHDHNHGRQRSGSDSNDIDELVEAGLKYIEKAATIGIRIGISHLRRRFAGNRADSH